MDKSLNPIKGECSHTSTNEHETQPDPFLEFVRKMMQPQTSSSDNKEIGASLSDGLPAPLPLVPYGQPGHALVGDSNNEEPQEQQLPLNEARAQVILAQSITFEMTPTAPLAIPGQPLHQTGTLSSRQTKLPCPLAFPPLKDGERGPQLVFKQEEGILWELCMPVVQDGNQRCTGPPYGHTGPRPSDECEVYGGLLPKDVYEDRIFGVFARYGTIFRIRILTKPDGSSQGYFHVHYYRKEAAEMAVSELNGFKFLGESTDKNGIRLRQITQINRLFISGIPNCFTNKHVYYILRVTKCGLGLIGVDVPQQMSYMNRGYCFLEYKDHMSALIAWQWISHLKPFKANVAINWAIPQAPKVEDPEKIGTYCFGNAQWIQELTPGTIPELF